MPSHDHDRPSEPATGTEQPPLVDWRGTGRRLRRSAAGLLGGAVVAWLLVGLVGGGPRLSELGNYLGAAVGGMVLVEIVVVGGSALRGMLRAGERGERLAGGDVSLLPPQVRGPDR